MELTIVPSNGHLQIDDARITFRNFEGREERYNRKGDRNFALVLPTEEMADTLIREGWNVKKKPPREEGEEMFCFLPVKVKFNERGPVVYLDSGKARAQLDEDSVKRLDEISIESVDMDLRPYDWEVNGKTGRTAYLQSIRVTQRLDRFARDDDDYPWED